MQRPVEQRECRALAGARERSALTELLTPFDVCGRQRAERAGHFSKGKVGEVALLERLQPAMKTIVGRTHDETGPAPRLILVLLARMRNILERLHAQVRQPEPAGFPSGLDGSNGADLRVLHVALRLDLDFA